MKGEWEVFGGGEGEREDGGERGWRGGGRWVLHAYHNLL